MVCSMYKRHVPLISPLLASCVCAHYGKKKSNGIPSNTWSEAVASFSVPAWLGQCYNLFKSVSGSIETARMQGRAT